MKRSLVFSLALIIVDQAIKLLIACNYTHIDIVFLPGILSITPVHNTNLNWISSMIGYKTPPLLMIVIQILALSMILLFYHYLSYLYIKREQSLNGMLLFFVAGIMCSFVDVMFWGGSLDYISLFDWFTSDLKDIYLTIGEVFLLYNAINYYSKSYRKMNKAERKQMGILSWIKKACPHSRTRMSDLIPFYKKRQAPLGL